MKILSNEKSKVLAERNGWSLAHAEGYIDGETFRRRGKTPSKYAQIGIDEYCLGFRAGYYERQNQDMERQNQNFAPQTSLPGLPVTRRWSPGPRDSVEAIAAPIVPAHSG
jgi:hypothetical protein